MKDLTVSHLKKRLAQKTKEELIKEISAMYQKFPQVKAYYNAREGNMQPVIKKHKDMIKKEFVHGKSRGLPKARLSVARKAVTDFKKLTDDPELIADVMFTYVESISQFNSDFSPDTEEFYNAPENMFEDALKLLKKHKLSDKFEYRAYNIVNRATEGWGHYDSLKERYEEVYGEFKI